MKKYASIHYSNYLQLEKILSSQDLRSESLGVKAHDEMLFIVIHQVYELWFKQIIHELTSIMEMFSDDKMDEHEISSAVARLDRVIEIQKLLIDQIRVLETMTPLDFLDFRNYLFPASGFQSFQFRVVEVMLGLRVNGRVTYNNAHFASVFTDEQRDYLIKVEEEKTLLDYLQDWLERTPFLKTQNFDFLSHYKNGVENMLEKEKKAILETDYLTDIEKEMRLKMLGDTDTYFLSVLDKKTHQELVEEGKLRLSYPATLAALFINLYRDEPILQMPFRLLTRLVDIDELFTTWRYRHAQMVLRMLGRKIGTGGSSGYDYLQSTAMKHHIYGDLHNISTLLIPRSELPVLPDEVRKKLDFYFSRANS
jgi:tryptophan 2,3-dioxygenase